MSKLSISIDLCQLQGAQIVTSKSGTQCLVLNLNESRAKLYNKKDGTLAVYLRLEAVGSDKLRNEDTHFVVEPTTKEEREGGLKLPIIGNGREYVNAVGQPQRQQQQPPRQQQRQPSRYQPPQPPPEHEGQWVADTDEDIPF